MRLLLYSGFLYLAGIALMLTLRPEFMFHSDGSWKEFGIGRNPDRYTWFPFWIFAIVWAIVSYVLIVFLASLNLLPGIEVQKDGSLINDSNISNLVYSFGDEETMADDMRNLAGEVAEVPLKSPEISPIITDLNDIGTPRANAANTRMRSVNATAPSRSKGANMNLKNGYYLLNVEATRRSGIPKYVFLGPEPPQGEVS